MKKSDLIKEISKKISSLSEKDISHGLNHIIEKMASSLEEGRRIEIRGFGAFDLHFRQPRLAHNPKTGEKLYTESKYIIRFKPGKEMRKKVNANQSSPIQET